MSVDVSSLIERALIGDVPALETLRRYATREDMEAVTATFVLTPEAVARVLVDHYNGAVSDQQTQLWASFARRGYLENSPASGAEGVSIDYEPAYEDAIVEALARMDELGDLIDGSFRPGEVDQLLAALRRA